MYDRNLQVGVKLGLERMESILRALGQPQLSYPTVHVAGTNGKGTMTWQLAKAYQAKGKRVGLFSSPHISTFRERIRVNDTLISEAEVEALLPEVMAAGQDASFFELATALAFLHFQRQEVDVAVIETGLGGRLDATNVLDPVLSIITSISYDHCEILGSTLEAIAVEKAGIIKPGRPVLYDESAPDVIRRIAEQRGSPVYTARDLYPKACELLQLSPEAGAASFPPCRFELCLYQGKQVLMDVAHNEAAFERLARNLQERFPGKTIRAFVARSKGKDLGQGLEALRSVVTELHFLNHSHPRLTSAIDGAWTLEQVFEEKWDAELTVFCGSFFIMADLRRHLGIEEPRDAMELNEMRLATAPALL
ncbi:MAG: hypothetical protein KDK78_11205 [Chlamydiia bacterium]|nr:hypothetical protein [Chlamydiia bacterium]